MDRSRQLVRLLCVSALTIMLSACGQNIFQGLAGESEKTTEELLQSGDYSAVIQLTSQVIQRTQTGIEAQDAVTAKANGILGQNDSLPRHSLQALSDLSSDSDKNIITEFSNSMPISPSSAIVAADLFNYADALATSTDITVLPEEIEDIVDSAATEWVTIQSISNPSLTPSMNSSAQFRRGFANATVVVKMCTLYLDITLENNTTTVAINSNAIANNIDEGDIVTYLSNLPRSILYYSQNAVDAFNKSNVLTSAQLESFNKITAVGLNFQALRDIQDNANSGTFTLVDADGNNAGEDPIVFSNMDAASARNAKYLSAFQLIFSASVGGN